MTANQLKPGDRFKFNPRGRKVFTVRKIHVLPDTMARPEDRGVLIVNTECSGCKQYRLRPECELTDCNAINQ